MERKPNNFDKPHTTVPRLVSRQALSRPPLGHAAELCQAPWAAFMDFAAKGVVPQLILAKAQEPYRTRYGLAAETGLRAGELCGLTVDDIDLERGMLQVP